jgi:carboxymethylenebutenolidase
MSQFETLMARDGHPFNAYIANPTTAARGGIVILQEIFGLNAAVRGCVDSFAADGYLTVAPALFDRICRDIELGYSAAEVEQAKGYAMQIDQGKALLDITAAVAFARHAGKVAVIGYCWGGLLAWLMACAVPINAAVAYYGGRIGQHLARTPMCPMMLHFGERDASIPREEIERIRTAFPSGIFHLYPAGHAFANGERPNNFNAEAAALARQRTVAFLSTTIG